MTTISINAVAAAAALALLSTAITPVKSTPPPSITPADVGVQLFQWKFTDIASECTEFLGPNGYTFVQTSPVQEHRSHQDSKSPYPWWLAYQPIGYGIGNRLGSEDEFAQMVKTCRAAGVDVVVDVVLNHMAGIGGRDNSGFGSNKPWSSVAFQESFPDAGYTSTHFHDSVCNHDIQDYNAIDNSLYTCRLGSLSDLDTSNSYVQYSIATFLNRLLSHGVIGFRADAAKYISLPDWKSIFSHLNSTYKNTAPYWGSEITGSFGDGTYRNYESLGTILNFDYAWDVGKTFRGSQPLSNLAGIISRMRIASGSATVFMENHDMERDAYYPAQGAPSLAAPSVYKKAVAFNLLYGYGVPIIHSGYDFKGVFDASAPFDAGTGMISAIGSRKGNTCGWPWVCQHRWNDVAGLVEMKKVLRAAVSSSSLPQLKVGGTSNQIYWNVGNSPSHGFVAINGENGRDFIAYNVQTGLPAGLYCNAVYASLNVAGTSCDLRDGVVLNRGEQVAYNVAANGVVTVNIKASDASQVLALHIR